MFVLTAIYFVSVAIVGYIAVMVALEERDKKRYLNFGDIFFYSIAGLPCSFFPLLNTVLAMLVVVHTLIEVYKDSDFANKRFFERNDQHTDVHLYCVHYRGVLRFGLQGGLLEPLRGRSRKHDVSVLSDS